MLKKILVWKDLADQPEVLCQNVYPCHVRGARWAEPSMAIQRDGTQGWQPFLSVCFPCTRLDNANGLFWGFFSGAERNSHATPDCRKNSSIAVTGYCCRRLRNSSDTSTCKLGLGISLCQRMQCFYEWHAPYWGCYTVWTARFHNEWIFHGILKIFHFLLIVLRTSWCCWFNTCLPVKVSTT